MPFGFGKGRGRGGRGHGRGFRGGRGRGIFGPQGPVGPPETCICPNCQTAVPHQLGLPCFRTRCPKCNSPMTRQFFQD